MQLLSFFGSIFFTFALLAITLIGCIAGAVFESKTGSHLHAAFFTYDHPFFQLLFWLLACNLFTAALKRWPWKKRHLPFLFAHLGLLLVLFSLLLSSHFALEGTLLLAPSLKEEMATLKQSYALYCRTRSSETVIPLKKGWNGSFKKTYFWQEENLQISIEESTPHATEERLLGWPNEGTINGWQIKKKLHQATHLPVVAFLPETSHLFFSTPKGQTALLPLDSLLFSHLFAFQEGFGGFFIAVTPPFSKRQEPIFWAPLIRTILPQTPLERWEENRPALFLSLAHPLGKEQVSLLWQLNEGLATPSPSQTFLLRFSRQKIPLPFSLTLREAQELYYPGTDQPKAVRCLVELEEKGRQSIHSLQLNHSLTTQSSYQLYLTRLLKAPNGEWLAEITLSYDPARYWLLYPGLFFILLGSALLLYRLNAKNIG